MVETTMSAEEATRLCESLSDTVDLGPGVQNELFALPEACASIQRLRDMITAGDSRLLEIETSFGKWFTEREWRGHDSRKIVPARSLRQSQQIEGEHSAHVFRAIAVRRLNLE